MENSFIFQFSSDLKDWQEIDITYPSDPRVTLGPSNPQGLRPVTITLSAPPVGSLFSRVKVTKI